MMFSAGMGMTATILVALPFVIVMRHAAALLLCWAW